MALDGDLAKAEPGTLHYRLPHAAAHLVRDGRGRTLKIAATWPWTDEVDRRGHHRLAADPGNTAARLTSRDRPNEKEKRPGARGTPATRPRSSAAVTPRSKNLGPEIRQTTADSSHQTA
jgi:hypothetical protein